MAKVTKSDVQRAIDGLRADNKKPTNVSIREFLGSGSNATINKYRKEIIDGEVTTEVKATNTLSDDEIIALSNTFAQLLANRVGGLGDKYLQHTKDIEDENHTLCGQLDEQQKVIEQLEQDKQQLENDKLILNSDLAKLEQSRLEQMEEIKGLYQKVGQVELLQQQLEQASKAKTTPRTRKTTTKKEG